MIFLPKLLLPSPYNGTLINLKLFRQCLKMGTAMGRWDQNTRCI